MVRQVLHTCLKLNIHACCLQVVFSEYKSSAKSLSICEQTMALKFKKFSISQPKKYASEVTGIYF